MRFSSPVARSRSAPGRPSSRDETAIAGEQRDGIDGSLGVEIADALPAQIFEPAPFPVAVAGLALGKQQLGLVEGIFFDLGGDQTDPGHVGLVLLALLGLLGQVAIPPGLSLRRLGLTLASRACPSASRA